MKFTDAVKSWVETLIRQELSQQQVVNYLRMHKHVHLHHETINQWIYTDKAAGGNLYKHFWVMSKPYRRRYGSYDRRGTLKNSVGIDHQPAIVDARKRMGDWEGDTIIGANRKSALLTLVERKSLCTRIIRLQGKHTEPLANAAIAQLSALKNRIKTITLDNGLEFAEHERIAKALNANIYFAHPCPSWERGTN